MLKKFLATILVLILLCFHSQAFAFTNSSSDITLHQHSTTKETEVFSSNTATDVDSTDSESNTVTNSEQTIVPKHPKLDITLSNAVHITIFVSIFVIICATSVTFLVKSGR